MEDSFWLRRTRAHRLLHSLPVFAAFLPVGPACGSAVSLQPFLGLVVSRAEC